MPGTIVFRPIEANIISKDKDIVGKMDPYLSFHLGGLKRVKGEVAKSGGQHPIWNDAITVEVSDQTSLTVDLKDKDMLIDDKIASFEVDLREVESQGRVRKWYPIFRRNEPAGELLMEATFNGGQGQFGSGLGQGGLYGAGVVGGTGLGQQQYGTTGLSQGQYGTGLSQGQYGTSGGIIQGQQYGTGLGQGQYGTSYSTGTTGTLPQGTTGMIGGQNLYGQSGQSGRVITTSGPVISHTSQSYVVKSGTQQSSLQQHQSYGSERILQGQQYSGTGLSQGQQYGGTGLLQGQQYGTGLTQGQQYGTGLNQGQQLGGTSYSAVPLQGGLQQGSLQQGGLQQGGLQQGLYGTGLQQGQLGGYPSQYGGLSQGQGQYGHVSSEQFAKEALLRGSDPLNTQQNYYYNTGLSGTHVGLGGYQGGVGQNLTQTPSFSGTDPLLYEGDKNRFSNPPRQVPFGAKNIDNYGLKHGSQQSTLNPGSTNPNQQYY